MTDATDDTTDEPEYSEYNEYLAIGPRAWGRGVTEDAALMNFAANFNADPDDDDVPVAIFEVPVDADWTITMFELQCDEVRGREDYEFEAEHLARLDDLSTQVSIATEEAFVEATEIEEDDDE